MNLCATFFILVNLCAFIQTNETEDQICRGINEYIKCIVNLENEDVEEIQKLINEISSKFSFHNKNCDIDEELRIMLGIDSRYVYTNLTNQITKEFEEREDKCLNTYLDRLQLYLYTPEFICQELASYFKCNQDSFNTTLEELDETMNVFKDELARFDLNCDFNKDTLTIACEKMVGRCLAMYFENVLQHKNDAAPTWTCSYTQAFNTCIAKSTCCSDTVTEMILQVEDIEFKRTGYSCESSRITMKTKKRKIIRSLAEIIAGSYQVALSETVSFLLQN
ncbi:uncharacterized protein LOC131939964 isoform X2 [Physella acuta]|uniref:uncharacterized protein LOC131939964 isoform X2 n=1 Tax=Physella acuta TaxID=109671 RepID=UPI0027DD3708|nr:uncharacterized protein LOC131939964 isoform X2 [Physella acuta]